ncbi:hypothetical protein QJU96_02110 [Pasteurella skyensis]|uniref:Uncharacterized protein n=1 Tax=Phocoenobacter skyensis TaxID=97481 RepID=A0AAJ6NCE9_9PAST|nr:hypothetical protein [Pasteurella skyensis]MDP8170082.1 hypothetical protein [Pasteurella skyensis]MDP8174264.1 hypothetical protein [Pasteurella skyensis]
MKKVILILSLLFMTSSSTAVNLKNLQVMDDGDYYACAISASIARIIMEKRQYNSADLEEMKGSIDMMLENAKKTIGTNINQVDYAGQDHTCKLTICSLFILFKRLNAKQKLFN